MGAGGADSVSSCWTAAAFVHGWGEVSRSGVAPDVYRGKQERARGSERQREGQEEGSRGREHKIDGAGRGAGGRGEVGDREDREARNINVREQEGNGGRRKDKDGTGGRRS